MSQLRSYQDSLLNPLQREGYHPHFTDGRTEAQRLALGGSVAEILFPPVSPTAELWC